LEAHRVQQFLAGVVQFVDDLVDLLGGAGVEVFDVAENAGDVGLGADPLDAGPAAFGKFVVRFARGVSGLVARARSFSRDSSSDSSRRVCTARSLTPIQASTGVRTRARCASKVLRACVGTLRTSVEVGSVIGMRQPPL
jgi:hypothetical protein